MMFGGVPMSVESPPRIDAKPRGISTSDGETSFRTATRIAIGSIKASAPTLFMNPDSAATVTVSTKVMKTGRVPIPASRLATVSTIPEFSRARLRTRRAATVMTAG